MIYIGYIAITFANAATHLQHIKKKREKKKKNSLSVAQ
jgi:hypothetical protein